MFRYKLRTLMILMAIGPPLVALAWLFPDFVAAIAPLVALLALIVVPICYGVRRAELLQERRRRRIKQIIAHEPSNHVQSLSRPT